MFTPFCWVFGIIDGDGGALLTAAHRKDDDMNPSIFESGTGWTVEVHPAKEGGYWGEVPALPGCSSFGATAAECRANVLEAAQGCIEVYAEEAFRAISSRRRRPSRQLVRA